MLDDTTIHAKTLHLQQQELTADAKQRLAQAFVDIVGADAVLTKEAECRPFECDGLTAYKQIPPIVVLPNTINQVQRIVSICHQEQVAIVPRGSGTSLSGGALPLKGGVSLALNRLNDIINIDADNRLIRVQPGITNRAVSDAVAHLGLFFAPDPSSQIVSSIGGNIAENAGGIHCLKYGLTRDNLAGVTMVMADGSLLTLGGEVFDAPGYDLLPIVCGSEGLLGIVVEATLRLLPIPEETRLIMAGFPTIVQAAEAVAAIITQGLTPAGLEMMDKPIKDLVEARYAPGYPEDCEALLLCELDGTKIDVDSQVDKAMGVLQDHGAEQLHIAGDEQERELLWKGRKSAFPAVATIAPDYYCMDGTVPRKHLAEVLESIYQLSQQHGLPVFNVFHAGDGNLHPLILYDAEVPGVIEKVECFGNDILKLCIHFNGTISGEHGIGVEKIKGMCAQFNSEELHQFQRLRQAFDSDMLLNPGKAIPTLSRCAEIGGMHVHKGQIPLPDIERF